MFKKSNLKYVMIFSTLLLVSLFLVVFISKNIAAKNVEKAKSKNLQIIAFMYEYILENYVDVVDQEKLYEGALKGMLDSLGDPHSTYLSKKDIEDLNKNTAVGEYGGLGLYIQKLPPQILSEKSKLTDGYIQIVAPFEGSPGYKAGLHAGDYITNIDDESVIALTSQEAVEKMTGKVGTTVKLTILRGEKTFFDVTIKRALIKTPTVKNTIIDNHIGYLRIVQWSALTKEDVKVALKDMVDNKKVDGIIIDLRSNPGGLLNIVVDIGGYFFKDKIIVSTKERDGNNEVIYKTNEKDIIVPENMPITVLIDKGSASASEIFAGAIKDYKRGLLIGETTYGKGSVQEAKNLFNDGFRLTTSRYYTPSGISIDKIGINPDIEVKEKEFSDKELEDFSKLIKEEIVGKFIKDNPDPTKMQINTFIKKIKQENKLTIEDRTLNKLVRNEINRKKDFPPIIDMEYDIVLQRAAEEINKQIK